MIFVAIGVLEKPVCRAGSLLLPLMVQSSGPAGGLCSLDLVASFVFPCFWANFNLLWVLVRRLSLCHYFP